jgi:hypothetical protein
MGTDPANPGQDPQPCKRWRFESGVYVLGALSPAERRAFEAHLTRCHPCRDDLISVAGLPGLLARLTPRRSDDTER